MIEYIPTENKFEELEIPKVTGYQKQFSIAPPRGDASENTPDTPSEPEVEETVEEIVEEAPVVKNSSTRYTDRNLFVKDLTDAYSKALQKRGISTDYASYLAIQDALESNFGKSYAGNWNFGNITVGSSGASYTLGKDSDGRGNTITQKFRNYDSLDDYVNNKIALLSGNRYRAFAGDISGIYNRIKAGGYATDPNYVKNLTRLYNQYFAPKGKEGMKIPITKSGSKIYIKPQNRGKFTRLKQRTGKSATWFKEHGTPAQKKMATFALNARKWKHQEGGSLLKTVPLVENYFRGYPYKSGKYSAAELLSNTGIPRIPADDYILNAPVNLDDYKDKQEYMESGFNSNAYNKYSKATGRFQITPIAHKEYTNRTGKTGDLNDPAYNEQVRDWYMNEYLPNTKVVKEGNAYPIVQAAKILAAYNYGPGALNKKLVALQKNGIDTTSSLEWVNHLNPETSNYIKFILMGEDVGRKTNEEFERLKRK